MDIEKIRAELGEDFISKYDRSSMHFLKWLNSFEYLLDVFKIVDDDKGKCLLNMIESSNLTKIEEKLSPTNPFDLPYDKLVSVLEETFGTASGVLAANYRFYARIQFPKETIDHYVLALRKLHSKCDPTVKSTTDIKNRFINGLEDKETKALLKRQSRALTFATAVGIAKKSELDCKELKINFN